MTEEDTSETSSLESLDTKKASSLKSLATNNKKVLGDVLLDKATFTKSDSVFIESGDINASDTSQPIVPITVDHDSELIWSVDLKKGGRRVAQGNKALVKFISDNNFITRYNMTKGRDIKGQISLQLLMEVIKRGYVVKYNNKEGEEDREILDYNAVASNHELMNRFSRMLINKNYYRKRKKALEEEEVNAIRNLDNNVVIKEKGNKSKKQKCKEKIEDKEKINETSNKILDDLLSSLANESTLPLDLKDKLPLSDLYSNWDEDRISAIHQKFSSPSELENDDEEWPITSNSYEPKEEHILEQSTYKSAGENLIGKKEAHDIITSNIQPNEKQKNEDNIQNEIITNPTIAPDESSTKVQFDLRKEDYRLDEEKRASETSNTTLKLEVLNQEENEKVLPMEVSNSDKIEKEIAVPIDTEFNAKVYIPSDFYDMIRGKYTRTFSVPPSSKLQKSFIETLERNKGTFIQDVRSRNFSFKSSMSIMSHNTNIEELSVQKLKGTSKKSEGNFVSDSIVDMYMLITESLLNGEEFAFVPSQQLTSALVMEKTEKRMEKLKNRCINSNYCFFPVHIVSPKHWFLCLLVKKQSENIRLLIFDSCPTKSASLILKKNVEPLLKEMFGIIDDTFSLQVKTPRQTTGDDCGIYMLHCMATILNYCSPMGSKQDITFNNIERLENLLQERITTNSVKDLRAKLYTLCESLISNKSREIKYRGMRNNSKCCWIIATLQFLFTETSWFHKIQEQLTAEISVEEVWESILFIYSQTIVLQDDEGDTKQRISGDEKPLPIDIILSFISLLIKTNPDKNIRELLETSKQNEVGQQDCAEFLTVLCDGAKYCPSASFSTRDESLICKNCNWEVPVWERVTRPNEAHHYCMLPMGETMTMQKLLDKSLDEDTIMKRCKKCYYLAQNKNPTEEEMTAFVEELLCPEQEHRRGKLIFINKPDILIISMPRAFFFKDDEGRFESVKNSTYIDIFDNEGRIGFGTYSYAIQAVVYHQGNDAQSGHFWCESKRPTILSNINKEREYKWHEFNDDTVKVLGEDHIQKCKKNRNMWKKRSSQCCLVMYKKEGNDS